MRKFHFIDYLQNHKPDNLTKGLFLLSSLLFSKRILKNKEILQEPSWYPFWNGTLLWGCGEKWQPSVP